MNLMTLIRLLVLLVIMWTVVSLSAGALGVGIHDVPELTFFLPRPALEEAMTEAKPDASGKVGYRLVDQTNGRVKPVALPETEAWSLLSVSPWRDRNGNLEAAGRWVSRGEGDEEFCGIGCLTLPDSTVKNRITLDVLPTGKPCWLPARPGEILFPAGDGQLYRCNITGRVRDKPADDRGRFSRQDEGNAVKARPVTWDAETPGEGVACVSDPAVLPDPGCRRLVFVALGAQERRGRTRMNLPTKLWWLLMNDEGDAIVGAGRLMDPGLNDDSDDRLFERLPTVVSRRDGKISLVYLTRLATDSSWQLRSTTLEIDPQTSLPRVVHGADPLLLAKNLRAEPPILSAWGESVYVIDQNGQIVEHLIPR